MNKEFESKKSLFLESMDLNNSTIHWNLQPAELVEKAILYEDATLTDTGALVIKTGEFTGRSPKDRFIVYDSITKDTVWWSDVNIKFLPEDFDRLYDAMIKYLKGKEIYIRDVYACADPKYRLNIRVISEFAFQSLFASNLFLRPTPEELSTFESEWTIIAVPSFKADSKANGTRQHNFSIINFSKKTILIGGTAYTGEIKKGIFSALNFILPYQKNVLSMHCSANIGKNGDTSIFFGLSGTGKTTLSADPERFLIGDDEHGWDDNTIFNFEGGCYAKCVDLTAQKEPQIFNALRFGALLENTKYYTNTRTVDFSNIEITENTRASYPIYHIANAVPTSMGRNCKNIFFLTADAFGVLPPISKLTKNQAMFHFISGYTAKVAGTEAGVIEPQTTFSACFGKAFLPLHPTFYADLLGKKIEENKVNIWLINTGWTGGPYGIGSRMKLAYTRAMISSAINGELDNVEFEMDPIFGLYMPVSCPNVPSEALNPRNTWKDKSAYDQKAKELALEFARNFKQFSDIASVDIKNAVPKYCLEEGILQI